MKLFYQQEGINYTNTFFDIAKMNSVRLIISLASCFGWPIHQMDVKSLFLHGDLDEEIYMEKPLGFMKYFTLVF
jgi:hypothetical protein